MKPKLIFISPGPRMSIATQDYKRLSEHFDGVIITSSEIEEVLRTKKIVTFEFFCIKFVYKHRILSIFRFFLNCILFAVKSRIQGEKYDLVITYDPLKTGLIGVIVSRILNTKFAPQVNGVYTSPAEYLDGKNRILVKFKKFLYPKIMYVVLKKADGIKLLFDGQLAPFNKIIQDKIIVSYPNYVDINKFMTNKNEKKEILFVGFPFKRKGVDILITAFKKIAPNFPDWKLKILGWFSDMKELYDAINGHPQIYHHAPVGYNEMPEHVGSCSILVLPSRSEAMGRILVEAMAAGKPRIGSNVDGIPTVINDGVDGLLFQSEDIDDLAIKLELLMNDHNLRKKLGENGRKRAREEFNEDMFYRNQINFYNRVLSK